eukprot:5386381-Amphidinium_carterae.1
MDICARGGVCSVEVYGVVTGNDHTSSSRMHCLILTFVNYYRGPGKDYKPQPALWHGVRNCLEFCHHAQSGK